MEGSETDERCSRRIPLADTWRSVIRVTRFWLRTSLVALALTGVPLPVASQVQTSSEERFFRIEWQLERVDGRPSAIVGSVRNHYLYPLQRVQVEAQVLDEGGQVIQQAFGVMTDVPPGGHGTFRLQPLATGARYVVTVHSFEFGAQQSP